MRGEEGGDLRRCCGRAGLLTGEWREHARKKLHRECKIFL